MDAMKIIAEECRWLPLFDLRSLYLSTCAVYSVSIFLFLLSQRPVVLLMYCVHLFVFLWSISIDDLAREGLFDTLMIPCCKDQIILNLRRGIYLDYNVDFVQLSIYMNYRFMVLCVLIVRH